MKTAAKATVVAIVVMLVLGGATAGASHLLTGSDIKNGSITGSDIKNHSISVSDLSVKRRALRGPEGPAGPPGPSAVGQLIRVEATKNVLPGGVDSVAVACPAGQNIVSGGFQSLGAETEVFFSDSFGSPNTWAVGLDNFYDSLTGTVTAVAFCAPAGQAVAAENKNARARDSVTDAVAARRASHTR